MASTGEVIVVTKRGKPVAQVIPVDEVQPAPLRGSVTYLLVHDVALVTRDERIRAAGIVQTIW